MKKNVIRVKVFNDNLGIGLWEEANNTWENIITDWADNLTPDVLEVREDEMAFNHIENRWYVRRGIRRADKNLKGEVIERNW